MKAGLRLLNVFIKQITSEKDYLLSEAQQVIRNNGLDKLTDNKAEEKAKKFLFTFASWLVYIHHIKSYIQIIRQQ
ncbi:hypothetical protein J32TS6_16070 [Virgibacillus pantothenticus]|nr:hypothetical protein J32TS6_16070 [Virgibacillus pantothenticus]SIT17458.1 hypothetical protein SAMN05421787_1312 [Virgibacillus pantothenticus]